MTRLQPHRKSVWGEEKGITEILQGPHFSPFLILGTRSKGCRLGDNESCHGTVQAGTAKAESVVVTSVHCAVGDPSIGKKRKLWGDLTAAF